MGKPAFDPSKPFEEAKPAFDPGKPFEAAGDPGVAAGMADADKMSRGEALKIGLERGVSFGARPMIAGAGGGLGAFLGSMEKDVKGEGLAEKIQRSISAVPAGYQDSRKDAIDQSARADKDRPGYAMAGDLAGNILTAPLVAAKGLAAMGKLGIAQGALRAASEADSPSQALEMMGEGGLYGVGGFLGAKGIEKGAKIVAPMAKAALGDVGEYAGKKIAGGLTKLGSTLTGISEDDIQTYAKNAKEISAMAKASDGNVAEAADQVRAKFSDSIGATRAKLNSEISTALQSSDKAVEAKPIMEALASQKAKINSKLYPKEIGQIDDLIEKVGSLSQDGKLKISDAHDIKAFLQDRASSAYGMPGDPASLGTEAAKAAKSGAAIARKLVNEAEPAIASANNKLSQLHEIIDNMNRNVFTQGKPEAALLAAGSGGNIRNSTALQDLGKATGTDMVGEAKKLSAMRTFQNPAWLPVDSTGKAAARFIGASAVMTPILGPAGPAIAAIASSPKTLKVAIDTGRISKQALSAIMGKPLEMTERGMTEAVQFLNTPKGQAIANQFLNQQKVAEGPIQRRLDRISKGSEQ